MDAGDIVVGKTVYYYSWADEDGSHSAPKKVVITSGVFEICGSQCCRVDGVSGCVCIENLSEHEYPASE